MEEKLTKEQIAELESLTPEEANQLEVLIRSNGEIKEEQLANVAGGSGLKKILDDYEKRRKMMEVPPPPGVVVPPARDFPKYSIPRDPTRFPEQELFLAQLRRLTKDDPAKLKKSNSKVL